MKEEHGRINVLIVDSEEDDAIILDIRKLIINLHQKQGSKKELAISLIDSQVNLFAHHLEFDFQIVILLNNNEKSDLIFQYLNGFFSGKAKFIVIGPEIETAAKHAKFEGAWVVSNTFNEVIPQFETLMGEK
ncbi:hypothetical protein HN784_03715 [bacterium]|nr:hypothetical protein [bacterium]MBT4251103.1 hypothetical protein [bacterium]MBT4598105.1 hypothetical protein [bacterium]MBT6753447.1 hypothetical protein [bacterium]MBT7038160.1 hypothetical protein [bacterium]